MVFLVILRKSILGREKSKCKFFEGGIELECFRNSKKVSVVGVKKVREDRLERLGSGVV